MPKHKTLEESYDSCLANGCIEPKAEVNLEKVRTNLAISEEDIQSAEDSLKKKRWNSAYKSYYDAIHGLVEALLVFDKVKSLNHQCLFAHLCVKHPGLELDWNFFEKLRTKRNGINYYGTPVSQTDWKEINVQTKLYISILKKEIEQKLKN